MLTERASRSTPLTGSNDDESNPTLSVSRPSLSNRGTRGRRSRGQTPRGSTPSRSRSTNRDFTDPDHVRDMFQALEDRFETLQADQRQGQDTLVRMLQNLTSGTDPNPVRDTSNPLLRTIEGDDRSDTNGVTSDRPLRNNSVPLSHMTYSGAPRLSKNVPKADPLSDGLDPTFKQ